MNADGTGVKHLAEASGEPTWSPDGRQIAFVQGLNQIHRIDVDGSNPELLARQPRKIRWLSWSPPQDSP